MEVVFASGDTVVASDGTPFVYPHVPWTDRDLRSWYRSSIRSSFGITAIGPTGDVACVVPAIGGKAVVVARVRNQSVAMGFTRLMEDDENDGLYVRAPVVTESGDVFWIGRQPWAGPRAPEHGSNRFFCNTRGDRIRQSKTELARIEENQETIIARVGQSAPGSIAGATFAAIKETVLGEGGHVFFKASRSGPGITPLSDESLWLWSLGAGLTQVASEGEAFSGRVVSGGSYDVFGEPTVGRSGSVAFWVRVRPPSNPMSSMLFAGTPGQLKEIDAASGNVIQALDDGRVVLDASGKVFVAGGPTTDVICDGVLFGGAARLESEPQLCFNSRGDYVATALVRVPGTAAPADRVSKFWVGGNGRLEELLQTGDTIEFRPGDVRKIRAIFGASINERGDMAFIASLDEQLGEYGPVTALMRVISSEGEAGTVRVGSTSTVPLGEIATRAGILADTVFVGQVAQLSTAIGTTLQQWKVPISRNVNSFQPPILRQDKVETTRQFYERVIQGQAEIDRAMEGVSRSGRVIKFTAARILEADYNEEVGQFQWVIKLATGWREEMCLFPERARDLFDGVSGREERKAVYRSLCQKFLAMESRLTMHHCVSAEEVARLSTLAKAGDLWGEFWVRISGDGHSQNECSENRTIWNRGVRERWGGMDNSNKKDEVTLLVQPRLEVLECRIVSKDGTVATFEPR